MRKSTVYGCSGRQALPPERVDNLKKYILSLFPEMRHHATEFEAKWKSCVDAINHACAILRTKKD
jgi:hypothetical protein